MLHIATNTYQVLDPWFGRQGSPVELDLGCGKGRFAMELARRHPDRLVVAADLMLGRLRRLDRRASRDGLGNLECLRANSLDLAGFQFPDNSIDRIHILCPDPWPKDRHRCKRLVTSDFLTRLARILVPGGILHMASDHPPYQETMLNVVEGLPFFEAAVDGIADIADIRTDFELMWLDQNKTVPHLAYRCCKGKEN